MLGILSHLTFAVVLAGLALSAAIYMRRTRRSVAAALFRTVVWFGLPVALLVTLYVVDVSQMMRGGGPTTPPDLATQAAAMTLGIPVGLPVAALFGILAMALCAVQVWRMHRAGDLAWPLGVVLLLYVPSVMLLWPRTDYLHPRYIYVAVPFLLIFLGLELQHWLAGPWWARMAACGALIAFVAVNAMQLWTLQRLGRGDYLAALQYLRAQTAGPNVVIGTDQVHPTSTLMVIQYYDWTDPASRRLATLHDEQAPGQWPQWLIVEQDFGPGMVTTNGVPFVREAAFPKGAVTSGVSWFIYESQSARPNVSAENLEVLSH
jgi:hypothetical protein